MHVCARRLRSHRVCICPERCGSTARSSPVRASVYFSGLLAAPRLTVFWLLVSEREMVQRVHNAAVARLQIIIGESKGSSVQVHGCLAYGGSQAARCSCMSALELSDLTWNKGRMKIQPDDTADQAKLHTSLGGWSDMEVHCMCRACGRCMVIAVLAMGHAGNGPLLGAYRRSWGSPGFSGS